MSFLHNKRKRDESSNESNTIFKDNNLQFKNGLDIINNSENILQDNNNSSNINNNNIDIFQKMFDSINSRKDDINPNNIIMSPLFRSSLFFNSIQKIKNYMSNDKAKIPFPKSNSSVFKNKLSSNNKNKFLFSPSSSFKLDKNYNCEGLLNNNYDKFPLRLDFGQFNFSEKKNIYELNSENKINDENRYNNFSIKQNNFFDNILLNNSNIKSNQKNIRSHLSIQKGEIFENSNNFNFPGTNPINTSIFAKNSIFNKNKKVMNKNKLSKNNSYEISKPFQTYNAKLIQKYKNDSNKEKSNKSKVFHIEKIYNKKEYKDANEKEEKDDDKNLMNRYKISLKKIKQIYINSCLKIYSYMNEKVSYDESNLNNELYITNIRKEVSEIIKSRKINSSKMNEILQVNDDDKYRKHYFMFTSEAKQFCLDLITKKNFPFDVVMKMCKVPRKSLRRWSYVGCNRKKGCGRKTKNPQMEAKLVEWYNNITKKGISVTAKMIRDKAVEISTDRDFLASKGWLEKFKRKFDIKIVNNKNRKFKRCINCDNNKNKNNNVNDEKIDYEINININENKNEKDKDLKNKILFVKANK